MQKGFSLSKARKTKSYLLRKGASPEKVNSLLLSWFKLKVLANALGKRFPLFGVYIRECYNKLFWLKEQEQYSEFLEHWIGEALRTESGVFGLAPAGPFQGAYDKSSPWRRFFGGDNISPAHVIPLSFFPLWKIDKPSKTKEVGNLPYSDAMEGEFRSKVREFLAKYCPDSIVIQSPEACYNPSVKRYADKGKVKRDYEIPEDWKGEYVVQSFLTGPLTLREVWLPPRITKLNNTFWFSLISKILRNVPYYANNYDTPEELHRQIKDKIQGYLMSFDITGFGLQYPRSMLRIIAEEIQLLYHAHWALDIQVAQFKDILDDVLVKFPDGTYMEPTRGIGLGYFETMKTIGILALLDASNPVAIFGDQGICPFSMRDRKNSPREVLPKYGFHFKTHQSTGESLGKTIILPKCETGIILAGCLMTPEHCVQMKSTFAPFSGALSGEFHWERKAALLSCKWSGDATIMERYIPFQYELAFGSEFYRGESICHPNNLGLNESAPEVIGLTRYTNVLRLVAPKVNIEAVHMLTPFAHRAPPVDRKIAKKFHKKRFHAYRANVLHWSPYYESTHPTFRMNRLKKPVLPDAARGTPWWLAVRSLLLNDIDIGRITYGITDPSALASAMAKYSLTENPWEARVTGGITVTSRHPEKFGVRTEHLEIARAILASKRNEFGLTIFRKDKSLPAYAAWDTQIDETYFEHLFNKKLKNQNPYLIRNFEETLTNQNLFGEEPLSGTDVLDNLRSQIRNVLEATNPIFENWDTFVLQHEEDNPLHDEDGSIAGESVIEDIDMADLYEEPDVGLRSPDSSRATTPVQWNI